MFTSENWKDYELLDAEGGERLERWGKYILIRPDPQIIWKGELRDERWRCADGVYKRSKTGGGRWVVSKMPDEWCINYGELQFKLRPMGFKHTGLFPEQAANWDWFSSLIRKRRESGKDVSVLNLFATWMRQRAWLRRQKRISDCRDLKTPRSDILLTTARNLSSGKFAGGINTTAL